MSSRSIPISKRFVKRVQRELTKMKNSKSPLCHTSKVSPNTEQEKQSRRFDDDFRGKKSSTTTAVAAAEKKLESQPSMDINESAELFINKFKQQLLIQRLESIENYEQMLARGT
ncbi:hypothetical protein LOK49_LG04G02587 [Camellia lanceoleosa]|uniref:Uncharacterized protein n=1 Tax=Camellia lanceoleosa TaxID=1840588 RepID=A0ACC0HWZ8_9ERIC|nr:hypothetical protein LOK49_LG04G02587 [Camellia lanceoleosa]